MSPSISELRQFTTRVGRDPLACGSVSLGPWGALTRQKSHFPSNHTHLSIMCRRAGFSATGCFENQRFKGHQEAFKSPFANRPVLFFRPLKTCHLMSSAGLFAKGLSKSPSLCFEVLAVRPSKCSITWWLGKDSTPHRSSLARRVLRLPWWSSICMEFFALFCFKNMICRLKRHSPF